MSSLSEQAENLSPEIKAAWEDFNTRVGAIVQDVFAPFSDNPFNIVIGAQFGGMGMPGSDMPPCLVSSGLPLCYLASAIEMMLECAVELHEEMHPLQPPDESGVDDVVTEVVGIGALHGEERQFVSSIAEMLGVPEEEEVGILRVADTSDLAALPTMPDEGEQQ